MKTFRLIILICFAFASGIALERFGAISSRAQGVSASQIIVGSSDGSDRAMLADPADIASDPKKLEDEVLKRSAYLAALVEDAKRLDRTPAPPGNDEVSDKNLKRGRKVAIGGGDRHPHAYYHFSGSSLRDELKRGGASNEAASAVVELSPLLQIDAHLATFAATPVGAPVMGEITSAFGYRSSPFEGGRSLHEGVDFAADPMTPVLATADGIVSYAGPKNGYGNTVIIQHKDGIETLYAHLSRTNVAIGSTVCRGQRVGLVGMTGHTTGPHVHYEVRINGIARNPMRFVELGPLVTAFAEAIDPSTDELASEEGAEMSLPASLAPKSAAAAVG